MKILILGSSGILGNKLYNVLKKKFKVYHNGIKSRKYELNNKNLKILINKTNPNYIINCSAVTNIDYCEKNKKNCRYINAEILKLIFNIKKKENLNFKLVHFSTDQMYDNTSLRSGKEILKPVVNNYYTKTKIMSESICLKNKTLIFRTNFFGYSKKGITFSQWVVNKFKNKEKFFLVDDVFFNPLSLTTISKIIHQIIKKDLYFSGIFNIGTKDKISKKNFAIKYAKLAKVYKKNYEIKKINDIVETRRSNNMYMNVKKFEKKFKIKLPKILNEIKKEVGYIK